MKTSTFFAEGLLLRNSPITKNDIRLLLTIVEMSVFHQRFAHAVWIKTFTTGNLKYMWVFLSRFEDFKYLSALFEYLNHFFSFRINQLLLNLIYLVWLRFVSVSSKIRVHKRSRVNFCKFLLIQMDISTWIHIIYICTVDKRRLLHNITALVKIGVISKHILFISKKATWGIMTDSSITCVFSVIKICSALSF